jgi:hypothetical protein
VLCSSVVWKHHFIKIIQDNNWYEVKVKAKNRSKTDRVLLLLTYSKGLPHVCEIIKKKMIVLYKSEKMKKVFIKPPIIAFRRDKNLKDILVKSSTRSVLDLFFAFTFTSYQLLSCIIFMVL